MKKLRCAIYTRKSTEEGLEQNFNSLDAQREACAAYILSQAGEGWVALKDQYDDGGFSGGNMERPGLKRLLADIEAGRIDVVVVYKVDRLTRALSDFSRIIETLDKSGASFVSITQSFNTTTSMGRLTLNVLLSFAQFEREVTGERIRDKIAASKAKGMWMGGSIPLGYDIRDRGLHINEAEAETIRTIFRRFLELPGTIALRDELERTGVRSKVWTARSGKQKGGFVYSRGGLNYLLRNRIYIGDVSHRGKAYPGQHQAILSREVFDAVQAKLAAAAPELVEARSSGRRPSLLGKLFDDAGNPMTSAHANKAGKRYFYYVSTALNAGKTRGSLTRLSAPKIEHAVADLVAPMLDAAWKADCAFSTRIVQAIRKIVVRPERLEVTLLRAAVDPARLALPDMRVADEAMSFEAPLLLHRTQRARTLLAAAHDEPPPLIDRPLVRALALARCWSREIATGTTPSLRAIAKREDICPSYARQILPLAFLAPDLVEAVLEGKQPPSLSLAALVAKPLPVLWDEQRALFATFS